MSKDYNALFMQNPEAFMRMYSCNPDSNIQGHRGDLHKTEFIPAGSMKDYRYRVMPPADHVAYLDFEKMHQPTDFDARNAVIKTHHATGQIRVTGSYTKDLSKVRSYFLPWEAEHIVSLTIPPMTAQNLGIPIFFTAGINGCSIFIKGSSQNPTILHAGGDTNRHDPTAGATFWRDLMETHNQTDTAAMGPTLAEVNKTQYTVDKVKLHTQKSASGKGAPIVTATKLGTEHSRQFESWLKNDQSSNYIIESVAPTGCVMGLRDLAGDWTFYLQENATITYHRFKKTGFLGLKKKKIEKSMNAVMRPLVFTQIYPGQGQVQFQPALSRGLKA